MDCHGREAPDNHRAVPRQSLGLVVGLVVQMQAELEVLDHGRQAFPQRHLRLPAEQLLRLGAAPACVSQVQCNDRAALGLCASASKTVALTRITGYSKGLRLVAPTLAPMAGLIPAQAASASSRDVPW